MKLHGIIKRKRARSRGPRALGATMVEFSLTFLVVAFVLFLLIEFALWIHCYNTLADAAKAGVRYAVVHGKGASNSPSGPSSCASSPCASDCTSSNATDVIAEVQKWAAFSIYSTSSMTVNVCYLDGTNAAPNRVRVTVSNSTLPFFGAFGGSFAVTAAALGRILY